MNLSEDTILNTSDIEELANLAMKSSSNILLLFDFLSGNKGTVKFRSEKILRHLCNITPKTMYLHFDKFVNLLKSENSILKWGAIFSIANLTFVDTGKRFEKIMDLYFSGISEKSMITASNIIKASAKIALAKPLLTDIIVNEILKSEIAHYENKGKISTECSNIVFGNAIDTFDKIYINVIQKQPVINFVKKQLKNTRKSVASKAMRFLKKYQIENS